MKIEVVRGQPTAAELAAIVAVLGQHEPQDEQTPAWRRAALREAVGGSPARTLADLTLLPGQQH